MFAHTFLATADERNRVPAPTDLIELAIPEFRRLFVVLLFALTHTIDTLLAWSRWRSQHQAPSTRMPLRRREQP